MDLIQLLVQNKLLSATAVPDIEKALRVPGASVEAALVDAGVGLLDILKAKADFYSVPHRVIGDKQVSFETLKLIPEESARHYMVAPLGVVDGALEVGITNPENLEARDALTFISAKLGMPYKLFLISEKDFSKVIEEYRGLSGEVGSALSELEQVATEDIEGGKASKRTSFEEESITDTASDSNNADAPITKIVATMLRHASEQRASDIHIEPMAGQTRVRFRIDGVLSTNITLPIKVHSSVVARIKVLSNMRLDEKRKPQDGRFSARVSGNKVDFRVSTFPTYYGEKVVMRILGASAKELRLEDLGLSPRNLEMIRVAIRKPFGMVLISGPTGSGKSTTLYAILNEIDRERHNVLSLEDPVEYTIPGVSQSQMRPEIGYTFASGLRTTLRQDPNIIMVGEIRDGETADLAVQAALTGHLVLSTIHTNNSVGIIARLLDMKIEPYLIPPVLVLGMAQRLVKKMCTGAGKKVAVESSMAKMLEKEFEGLPAEAAAQLPKMDYIHRLSPTAECPSGTSGRVSASEVFEMTPELEKAILAGESEDGLSKIVRAQGMLTIKEDAIIKSIKGIIPFEEVNMLGGEFELSELEVGEGESVGVAKLKTLNSQGEETEADTNTSNEDAADVAAGTTKEINL